MKTGSTTLLSLCFLAIVPNLPAAEEEDQASQLAKQLANPIASLISDDRSDISATFIQPFIAYTTKTHTTFTLSSESTYDWESSQWTVPVIGQISQVLKIGRQPVSVQLGGKYYAEGPSGAPEWGVRLNFTLLYPTGKRAPEHESFKK